jgi:predicted nucleic acid-binding protein
MIVVDANVIVALLLNTDQKSVAAAALERDRDWCAPRLWRSEYRNVLATMMRHEILDLSTALDAWESALVLVDGSEYEPAGLDVLRLAAESGCTAYDTEYAVVALDLGVPLVTLDRELLAAFPDVAVLLEEFVES